MKNYDLSEIVASLINDDHTPNETEIRTKYEVRRRDSLVEVEVNDVTYYIQEKKEQPED